VFTNIEVDCLVGHRNNKRNRPLLLCSNKDRTQLLIDNTDKLGQWLEKDGSTDQELAYWIPKYIPMRGDKPFADMGAMSSHMKALAQSQDLDTFL
jgi:hypothetical protein